MRIFALLAVLSPVFTFGQNSSEKNGGLGFTFKTDSSGYVKVINVRKNYPAANAGIRQNDLILKINNLSVYKMNSDTVVSYLKGEPGSRVSIQIKRNGKLADLNLVRSELFQPAPASLVVENNSQGDTALFHTYVHIDNNGWQFLSNNIFIYRLDGSTHSSSLVFTDLNNDLLNKFPQLDTVWKFDLGLSRKEEARQSGYLIFYTNEYVHSRLKDLLQFSSDRSRYDALILYSDISFSQRHELGKTWSDKITGVDNYLFTYPLELMDAGDFVDSIARYSAVGKSNGDISLNLSMDPGNADLLFDLVKKTRQVITVSSDYSIDTVYNKMIEKSVADNEHLRNSRGVPEIPDVNKAFNYSMAEIRKTLKQWEEPVGMLIYTLAGDAVNVVYLNNKGRSDTAVFPLTTAQLTDLETQLKKAIKAKAFTTSRGGEVFNSASSINADSLCKEISAMLLPSRFHLEEIKHLVICPAYNLAAFPFAMLKIKDSVLIDRMSFSITPSIKEFIINGFNNNTTEDYRYAQQLSVMGNREFKSPEEWTKALFIVDPVNTGITAKRFQNLPGAKAEIDIINKVVPNGVILSGNKAIKQSIISEMADADLVYFATHGIADQKDPLNKSFVLISGDAPEAYLTAKEIQQSKLKAMLVVLSACQTGLGNSHQGGMIGLSRAFQLAGAKNVLMSLWDISDSKTPLLMKYFFEALYKDKIHSFFPYDAFRSAVIKFKKENPDPEYWAAFSMFGVPY